MAVSSEIYNSVYEQVRLLGLPYKIKESGGSIVIRISVDERQKSFSKEREKLRFYSKRTFNGSSNSNWRKPEIFNDKSAQCSEQIFS